MPKISFYFLLHQPYRLADHSVLDLSTGQDYFWRDHYDQNREVFLKVADKSYRPMLNLLWHLVQTQPQFKFSFSTSGVFLEQAELWTPDVLELLQKLARRRHQVEILGENYYHSLAALYSPKEFTRQVIQHEARLFELFKVQPQVFRNTEMIYNDQIAELVAHLGYQGMLTEAVDQYLGGGGREQVWRSHARPSLPLLLKHAQLSDDIAFRFSQRSWCGWPLTAEKYLSWLGNYAPDDIIGLFMDFETFGEHQWASTGIFDFFAALVQQSLVGQLVNYITPSEALVPAPSTNRARWLASLPVYAVSQPISWADENRDLSAWRSNVLQNDTLKHIYDLEEQIIASRDQKLLGDWRRLQTSDHFYYMCTKYFADGDVHAYFSAYNSPLEAYRRFCIVLADLRERCQCQSA
jgi:alpha-amylase